MKKAVLVTIGVLLALSGPVGAQRQRPNVPPPKQPPASTSAPQPGSTPHAQSTVRAEGIVVSYKTPELVLEQTVMAFGTATRVKNTYYITSDTQLPAKGWKPALKSKVTLFFVKDSQGKRDIVEFSK